MGAYVMAGAQLLQGLQKKSEANYNADVTQQEGITAGQQTNVAEGLQRRSARESLGRSAAAFASAGVGPGSSTGVMDQAAVNAELDALNVRYRGQFTKYGYAQQAKLDKQAGSDSLTASVLNAGAAYLKGSAGGYTSG